MRGQESVPGSIAMMSGLMLGLSVGLGGIAVTPFGLIAEHFGLPIVIAVTAALPLLGARPDALRAPSERGEGLGDLIGLAALCSRQTHRNELSATL